KTGKRAWRFWTTPASGEPPEFADNVRNLLRSLLSLERGEASIKGTKIVLAGAPSSAAIAEQVTAAVTAMGGTVTLEPPAVADYSVSLMKVAGALTITGFVPNAATRDRLAAQPGTDATGVKLGRGAPDGFAQALDFGLAVLANLRDGQFDIKGTRLTLGGRAASATDFNAAVAEAKKGAPAGFTLATAELHPPLVAPFAWSATKAADGGVTIAGSQPPDDALRDALHARVAKLTADTAESADGAPPDFAASAQKGLEILALLDTGSLALDGTRWSIEGTVDNAGKASAVDAAYASAVLRAAGWTFTVHAPVEQTLPIIAPYTWHAVKAADGAVNLSGFVPSDDVRAALSAKAPAASDIATLGAGAPDSFAATAGAALDALMALSEGSVGLDADRWSLTGAIPTTADRDAVLAALAGKIDIAAWQIAVQAADAAPMVTPYLWSATKTADGSVLLAGYVPNDALKRQSTTDAGSLAQDTTSFASGEPNGFAAHVTSGLAALSHLLDGAARFDGGSWSLNGTAASAEQADAARAALADQVADWTVRLSVTSPSEPAPLSSSASEAQPSSSSVEPEPSSSASSAEPAVSSEPSAIVSSSASEPPTPVAPESPRWADFKTASMLLCQARVDTLADKNAILFKAGSATLTPDSLGVIDELAADLGLCPRSYVHVQGHTDADGNADVNLGLSVARSEAVVASLVERGVAEDRLYAEGFGETDPIASNDTKAGKQRNRRIAFEITPE
ncbi:MAG: OmpA family protein, partial [Devosia sp.]